MTTELETVTVKEADPQRRKAGRPKKGEVVAKKSKNRGTLGRPAGDKAIMDEFKARMLNSPKSARVLEAIFDAALDNDHKAQAAAWKLIIDRIAPVSAFELAKAGGNGMPQISINISSFAQPVVETVDNLDISDVEYREDSKDC